MREKEKLTTIIKTIYNYVYSQIRNQLYLRFAKNIENTLKNNFDVVNRMNYKLYYEIYCYFEDEGKYYQQKLKQRYNIFFN